MPNFKKLAKKYEKESVNALKGFVRKASVYDKTSVGELAPYGAGVKGALDYVAKLGRDFGFKVDTCGGYCTELTIGEEGPLIGVYAHADVVPVSGKWDCAPFEGKIVGEGKDAKMIGRGTSDDKGPLIAALYAVKLLKDNGLVKGYRIRFVAGGDEERGSSCLEHYFHDLKKPASDYGFTPDAEFPLIYGEKAITGFNLVKNADLSPIIAIDGGVVSNAVCDKVVATLPLDKKFIEYFSKEKIDGSISEVAPIMIVTFKGKSAHGSTPHLGNNAAAKAFEVLGTFYKNDFLVKLGRIIADCNGETWGGKDVSKDFGPSTYNYGIVKYNGKTLSVSVDYRHDEKVDWANRVELLCKATGMEKSGHRLAPALLFDKKSPLVATLMKSYKRTTHRIFDKPLAIGGGTYAKEAPNCVAFGSAFKGREGNIHSPNEFIYLRDLFAQIYIYADAIYSLGNIKK